MGSREMYSTYIQYLTKIFGLARGARGNAQDLSKYIVLGLGGIATRAVRARSAWVLEVTSWGRGTSWRGVAPTYTHTHRRGPRDPRTECVGFGGKFIGAWHELEGAA